MNLSPSLPFPHPNQLVPPGPWPGLLPVSTESPSLTACLSSNWPVISTEGKKSEPCVFVSPLRGIWAPPASGCVLFLGDWVGASLAVRMESLACRRSRRVKQRNFKATQWRYYRWEALREAWGFWLWGGFLFGLGAEQSATFWACF